MAKKPDDNKPGDDADDEVEFTDAQLDKIGKIVNAAVASHSQRKLPAMIKEAVTAGFSELKESLGAGGGDPKGDEKPQGGSGPTENEKKLQAKLDEMDKRLKAVTDDATKRTKAADDAKRDAELTAALSSAGVPKERIRGAVAILRESVKLGEDGAAKYVAKRDGYEDELDLPSGVKEWAGSDEGKAYVGTPTQQRPAGGSGTPRRGASKVIGGGAPATAQQAAQQKAEKKAAAQQRLTEQVSALLNGGGSIDMT
jgi:hypothetical protein